MAQGVGWGERHGLGPQPRPRSGSHIQAGAQLFYIKALREISNIYAEHGDIRGNLEPSTCSVNVKNSVKNQTLPRCYYKKKLICTFGIGLKM